MIFLNNWLTLEKAEKEKYGQVPIGVFWLPKDIQDTEEFCNKGVNICHTEEDGECGLLFPPLKTSWSRKGKSVIVNCLQEMIPKIE